MGASCHLFRCFGIVFFALLLAGAPLAGQERTPIDQVPMYGGMDRSQHPELKAADEKLIDDLTRHFGSRARAAQAWIE